MDAKRSPRIDSRNEKSPRKWATEWSVKEWQRLGYRTRRALRLVVFSDPRIQLALHPRLYAFRLTRYKDGFTIRHPQQTSGLPAAQFLRLKLGILKQGEVTVKRISVSLVLALATFTIAFSMQQPTTVEPGWEKFTSTEGRFAVLLPTKPKADSREVDTKVGKLTLYSFSSSGANGYFGISYGDYPSSPRDSAQAEQVLDGVRNGVVSGAGAKLTSEKKVTIKGNPGREIVASARIEESDVICTWRIYLVGRRLYQFASLTTVRDANHPDVAKFLNSVEFKDE